MTRLALLLFTAVITILAVAWAFGGVLNHC